MVNQDRKFLVQVSISFVAHCERVVGKSMSNTVTGNPWIKGNMYVDGEEVDVVKNKKIKVSV